MLRRFSAFWQRPFSFDKVTQGWLIITTGSAVRMGINFVTGILLARGLGPEQYGIFSLLGAVASISGVIIDFGLTGASIRYIAIEWQRNRQTALQQAQTFFWLRVILAATLIGLIILLAPFLATLVWPQANGSLLLVLAFLSMGTTVLSGSANAILEATRYFGRITAIIITNSIFSLVMVVLLTITNKLTLEFAFIGSSLMGSLAGFALVFWLWPEPWRKTAVSRPILRFPGFATLRRLGPALWHFGGWLWIGNILRVLTSYVDLFLINRWLSTGMVGTYALALNLASKVELINNSLHAALVPTVSALPDKAAVRHYLKQSGRRSLWLCLPLLALFPAAPWLIQWVYGNAYQPAVPLFQLLLLAAMIDLFTLGPILLVYTFNKPILLAGGELLQTIILIGGGAWLTPKLGPNGTILARLCAKSLRAAFVLILLLPQYHNFLAEPDL